MLRLMMIMDLVKSLKQGLQILKLDVKTISVVASDKSATTTALLFVVIAGILGGIAARSIGQAVIMAIMYVIVLVISTGVVHVVAKVLGGKGEYMQLLRTLGFVYIVHWPAIIPVIGGLLVLVLGLWSIIAEIIIVRTVHQLSTVKAVLVILIPLIVVAAIGFLVMGAFMAAFLGTMAMS